VWRHPGSRRRSSTHGCATSPSRAKRRGVADATSATKEEDVEEEGEFVAEGFEEGVEDGIGVDEEV